MCFTDKIKRNCIRKEDRIPDLVQPPGQIRYDGAGRHIFVVSEPKFRWFYKMILNFFIFL